MATPIGNLADLSPRARQVLAEVAAVAAEDTRVTGRLLSHLGLSKRLIACHEHNEQRAVAPVLKLLEAGQSVALTCDAGTPAISDPGARLVSEARAAGFTVTPVPGANAAIAALSVSGLFARHFLFCGFLPERPAARRRALEPLARLPYPVVFHEAPHRIEESLEDMRAAFGDDRRVVVARELTKLFETVRGCTLAEAASWVKAEPLQRRGEFVLIVDGTQVQPEPDDAAAERTLVALLGALPLRQAVGLASEITGAGKNALYRKALALRKGSRS